MSDRPGGRGVAPALALVAAGGAVGTLGRYGITRAFPVGTTSFPTTTLVVNLAGAFALAVLLERLVRRGVPDHWLRLLVGVGALGAFTTFSTLTLEVAERWRDGRVALALGYVAASVIGGTVAVLGGLAVGGRRRGRVPDEGGS